MNSPSERIRAMAQSGKLTGDEAENLLRALDADAPATPARALRHMLNPFLRFGGGFGAAVGGSLAAVSLLYAPFRIRFDGFLDLHVSRGANTLALAVAEQVASVLLPALVFFGFSLALRSKARFVDFIATTGLSRVPYVLAALPIAMLHVPVPELGTAPNVTIGLVAVAGLSLACVAWSVTWLYLGFKNASGLRGSKLAGSFICAMVIAEVLSKIIVAVASVTLVQR
jgi:hypothetical protein